MAADEACGPQLQDHCATVSYSFTATGGYPPYTFICNFDSPNQFLAGSTTVTCMARDSKGDTSREASFTVTVTPPSSNGGSSGGDSGGGGGTGSGSSSGGGSGGSSGGGTGGSSGGGSAGSSGGSQGSSPSGADTTPPTIAKHPKVTVFATGPAGAVVTYTVIASDPDNTGADVTISCLPASGSTFPLGRDGVTRATTVTCDAHDPAGNTATPQSFTVTVVGLQTHVLRRRTRSRECVLGPLPDRRCSPGASYSKLTKAVICSPSFHASTIAHVTTSMSRKIEREYGLTPTGYGKRLEIDRIVPAGLGGSNSIANLFPEKIRFADGSPGYRVKDKLEKRLHTMVCSGEITLYAARHQIARNWTRLYEKVFGVAPTG